MKFNFYTWGIVFFISLFFLFNLVTALDVDDGVADIDVVGVIVDAPTTITEDVNYTKVNVNSSEFWDNLNTPADINAGDITDDGTYVKIAGDTMTGNLIIDANQIIDNTNTEALLIRKNADGGDLFTVDTTNNRVTIGAIADVNNAKLQIGLDDDDLDGLSITQDSASGTALNSLLFELQKFSTGTRTSAINMNGIQNWLQAGNRLTGASGGFIIETYYPMSNTMTYAGGDDDATGVQVFVKNMRGISNSVNDYSVNKIDTSYGANQHSLTGMNNAVNSGMDLNIAGETASVEAIGIICNVASDNTEIAGTLNTDSIGISLSVAQLDSPTNGEYNVYGLLIDGLTNADTNGDLYGIYDKTSADWLMKGDFIFDADSKGVVFGDGQDASITYDGTDLIINPKEVGSGVLNITGDLKVEEDAILNGNLNVSGCIVYNITAGTPITLGDCA